MIAGFATWLVSPIGRVLTMLAGVLMASGILFALYKNHVNNIKQDAQNEWNKKQLELVVAENEKLMKKLESIEEIQAEIVKKVGVKNQKVQQRANETRYYLNSPEARQQDKPASPIIKETIRRLQQ